MSVTWLHVSDFHLSDKGPYNQEVILNALVSSVRRFREEEGRTTDLIFATGDIANQGKAKEYEFATKFFDDLLEAAGLNRDRLFIVPGNHDVDRIAGEFLVRTITSEESADRFFSPDKPFSHLTIKFHAFSEWYNDYFKTIRVFPTNTTCSSVENVTINNIRIAVLPLNSALFCIDDNDHEKLFIGCRCLDEAKKQLVIADLTIALIHHPLNWLSSVEQVKIRRKLVASVDMLLQGHFHQQITESINSPQGEYIRLAAGAAWQTRQWPNSAMYATFDGNQVSIFPIRYENIPEYWTLDTSLYPEPYTKSFPLIRRPNNPVRNTPQPDKQHHLYAERYQAMLKEELGYIRMLGLPGVESIKVNLNDDTFVPLRLSDRQGNAGKQKNNLEGGEHILYPDDIMKQAFQDGRGRRMLLVIGDPGSGKTTLLKYYALCVLEDYSRLGFIKTVNLFYLPLRELVRDKEGKYISLPANLANWSGNHQQTIAAVVFSDWLNSGTSLVLLDGLDEISNTAERIEVCEWIYNAWTGFSKCYFVVTSRATGYNKDEGIELECDYKRADVQDFTQEQQERFLRSWFTAAFLKEPCEEGFDDAGWQEKKTKEADQRTQTIVAHLKKEKNKGLRQLAAIPMILQIMAILWKDREYMPESRVELYESALNYLLEFRDKRRKIKPLLSASNARQVLAPISLWMQDTLKKDEVAKDDMHTEMFEWLNTLDNPPSPDAFCDYLVKRAGLLVESAGKEYFFRHKSFREYLAGFQLKEDRPYEQLNKLVAHFGEDWWEEPLRFFFGSIDAKVFNAFMKKLFDSEVSEAMTPKQQLFLQTIIEEAKGKKVDALCKKLLEPSTTSSRQRVILDCLKTIAKPVALGTLLRFKNEGHAKENKDITSRTDEIIRALGGKEENPDIEKPIFGITRSIFNKNEQNAEYILIPGGSYIYSVTKKVVQVGNLYVAKYPVTNQLYRSFIAAIGEASGFKEKLNEIAISKKWDAGFEEYLISGKDDLAGLFRSECDEDRKFGGDNHPVVGTTWFAAQAYCLWLSLIRDEDNAIYRLPTEIEWEWAAGGRQGTTGKEVRVYPWMEEKGKPTSILLNYNSNVDATTPVGNYPEGVTPEGLYDMAGNVWKWTDSLFDATTDSNRVLRGGSWRSNPGRCRSTYRFDSPPNSRGNRAGFRPVFVP
ncbi:MAG: SUMF1/EgtB/PvdO family nonheme iron enzyme [Chlorobiaceae bacterium]|nr:SUMF1/EgtB/PvdO family nonheme iron enzyme [Chlorobiaceae bacterium]